MPTLSFSIIKKDGSLYKRTLPWRRVWESKSRYRKRFSWSESFLPHTGSGETFSHKANTSILANCAAEYRLSRYADPRLNITLFRPYEVATEAGFLVLDFDVLPAGIESWQELSDILEQRLHKLAIDGIFMTSARGKLKVLVPVLHDLATTKHGTREERLRAAIAVAGPMVMHAIDDTHAALSTAFMTRQAVEEFLFQTVRPLRPASLGDLVKSYKSTEYKTIPPIDHESASEPRVVQESLLKTLETSAAECSAGKLAESILKRTVSHQPSAKRGRPPRKTNRIMRAILAYMFMGGGAISAAAIRNHEKIRRYPRRTIELAINNLIEHGIITVSAKQIVKKASRGLILSDQTRLIQDVCTFFDTYGKIVFPQNGEWNAKLFVFTGLFDTEEKYLHFVSRLPGFANKEDRKIQAESAWRSHQKRRSSMKPPAL